MSLPEPDADPWLWLEQVQGEQALAWVRERNAESRARLEAWPAFADTRRRIREVLDAQDRIPAVLRRGDHLYNFWQDAAQPRGLWRRCSLHEYRKPQPAWELLLDLDALGRSEGENWVWGGAVCLGPHYRRALLSLSRGGADADVDTLMRPVPGRGPAGARSRGCSRTLRRAHERGRAARSRRIRPAIRLLGGQLRHGQRTGSRIRPLDEPTRGAFLRAGDPENPLNPVELALSVRNLADELDSPPLTR